MTRPGYKQSETTLNKNVVKWLNSITGCYAEKRQATAGNRGKPDITGCIFGIRIELEGKIGYNKPTPIQRMWLKRWAKAGAISGVFWSLDEAKDIVKKQLEELGKFKHGIYT